MKKLTLACALLIPVSVCIAQPFTGQDLNPLRTVIGDDWATLPSTYENDNYAFTIYRDNSGGPYTKSYPGINFVTPGGGFNMGISMDPAQGYGLGNTYMKATVLGSGATSRSIIYDFMGSSFPGFFKFGSLGNNFKTLIVASNERIGIGTDNFPTSVPVPNTSDNYRLFVKGGIKAEEVLVELSSTGGWGDYVFEKNYQLMTLPALKQFITVNKHLPNMPCAQELVDNGGIEMGKMIKMQQVQIEENTLYTIQLNETIEELKKQNELLINRLETLEKQIK